MSRNFEGRLEKALHHFKYAVGLGEAHLQIDLRELRLTVGAQVFIAEAAHDLKVLVEVRDHQDLLEELRRLRQRVKRSRINAARHQIVARALRRGARHKGRLDLEEALIRKILPDGQRHFVPQFDIGLHLRAAQIDVAILEPDFFAGQRGVRRKERQWLRFVEQLQFLDRDFNLSGRNVLVDGLLVALAHGADCRDHKLRTQVVGFFVQRGVVALIEHKLRHPAAVADIHKKQVAQIAAAVHPSQQHHALPGMSGTKLSAHMSAAKIT